MEQYQNGNGKGQEPLQLPADAAEVLLSLGPVPDRGERRIQCHVQETDIRKKHKASHDKAGDAILLVEGIRAHQEPVVKPLIVVEK